MLRFLLLCKRRLDERGFDPRSKFYQSVCTAYDAMHTLHLELHYESCGRVVRRPPLGGVTDHRHQALPLRVAAQS
jgi:hypothetical protein